MKRLAHVAIATFFCASTASASPELIAAAKSNDLHSLQVELQNGADPDFKNATGFTSVMLAAIRGHVDVVDHLLANGADVSQVNRSGYSLAAVVATSRHDPAELVPILVKHNADLEGNYGDWEMTPFHLAILNQNTQTALAFMDQNVDLVAKDRVGDPALHAAIFQRNPVVLDALLEAGVDPFEVNNSGENSVEFMVHWGHVDFAMPHILKAHPEICERVECPS